MRIERPSRPAPKERGNGRGDETGINRGDLAYTILWYRVAWQQDWYLGRMDQRVSPASDHDPNWWLTFVQVGAFSPAWKRLGLSDEELRELEIAILEDPTGAPVVAGAGGLRKMRFSPSSWRRGKSGAMRVYYALFQKYGTVFLIFVHDKNYAQMLPASEKGEIKAWMERTDRAFRQSGARSSRS